MKTIILATVYDSKGRFYIEEFNLVSNRDTEKVIAGLASRDEVINIQIIRK